MDYKRIHDLIIERAKNRHLEGYSEKHHILPACLGGTNDKSNLVKLTAKEHFIVHKLLCMIYPHESKLQYAVWAFCNWKSTGQKRNYHIGSREYEKLRKEFSITHSNRLLGIKLGPQTHDHISKRTSQLKGSGNGMFGKTHTEKARLAIKNAQTGSSNSQYGKTGVNHSSSKMYILNNNGINEEYESTADIIKRVEELGIKWNTLRQYSKKNKYVKGCIVTSRLNILKNVDI
jgi:hypothetical protein